MKTSQRGIDLIAEFEGFPSQQPYNDPTGHCTAGYGRLLHRGPCTDADVRRWRGLTKAQAKQMLAEDVRDYEACVNAIRVPLSQNQYDALVSFAFNLGCGALDPAKSTLARKLNAGDYAGARLEFHRWNRGGGRVLPGLVRRRAAEARLFGSGQSPDPGGGPMSRTYVKRLQKRLREIGWPIAVDGEYGPQTTAAVADFRRGYAFRKYRKDGDLPSRPFDRRGKVTDLYRAVRYSARKGGRCSKHFAYREFASKGNGWIRTDRELVRGLERLRRLQGPISVVSGYRDPAHNSRVGGATSSRHMAGDAADIPPAVSLERVKALGVFRGIGYQGATGLVRHVDVRPGSARNPTVWRY